jgi:hypothetical protein
MNLDGREPLPLDNLLDPGSFHQAGDFLQEVFGIRGAQIGEEYLAAHDV